MEEEKNPRIRKLDHLDQTLQYCKRMGMTYAEYQKMQTLLWIEEQERIKRRKKKHGKDI